MAYSKANAEKEWHRWKIEEETKMRELGMDQNTIHQLHCYDWDAFKAERNYIYWQSVNNSRIDIQYDLIHQKEILTIEDLLESIDHEELHTVLLATDKLTLKILLLKVQGYSTNEICKKLSISAYTIYNRIKRIKQKLKIFFESD